MAKKKTAKKKFTGAVGHDIFLKTLNVVKQALKDNPDMPDLHIHRHKPIAQGLLNCSEIIIRRGLHDRNVEKHYKILKQVEEMNFEECPAGFEVKHGNRIICYDLNDAKKYYVYLRGKYVKKVSAGKKKCQIKRQPGYLYFVDKEGDISRVKSGKKKGKTRKMCKCGIKKKKGYLYYVNKKGTVSKSKMKKKKKSTKG